MCLVSHAYYRTVAQGPNEFDVTDFYPICYFIIIYLSLIVYQAAFVYVNHTQFHSWNQPVLLPIKYLQFNTIVSDFSYY